MSAEIIAIGSELTCGAKLDTNSQWLSQELETLGWHVTRHTALADSVEDLAAEFRAAARRSQVVIVTGGLGPTLDDITREAMALAFEDELIEDAEMLAGIESLFAARGREMPERNRRQAMRPRTAEPIPNACGTAPGILMQIPGSGEPAGPGCLIAALPGVPAEMKQMFSEQVAPRITGSRAFVRRVLIRTFGLGESDVEQRLGDLTARGRNPEVGITASEAVITLSVTARADTPDVCEELTRVTVNEILSRLGTAVYGFGDLELHECVGAMLQQSGHRIAVVEGSATGGLISHWLLDDDQHAGYVLEAKSRPGSMTRADSGTGGSPEKWERTFREEAAAFRESTGADFVVQTSAKWDATADSGVAVRHGYVAVSGRDQFEVADVAMTGNLSVFRARAARTALNILRLILQHGESPTCEIPQPGRLLG